MHRHQNVGRKFSRNKGPRKAMLRSLATSIILYEKIKTTLPKAKEIRPIVEKLITTAKKGDLSAVRELNSFLYDQKATEKLVKEIAPLYAKRNGGYLRIVKTGFRAGDSAKMAIVELLDVEKLVVEKKVEKKPAEAEKKQAEKSAPKAKTSAKTTTKKETK